MNFQGIIEVSELAEHTGNPALVILDCRYNLAEHEAGEQAFLENHIPGARYASLHRDLAGPCARLGGRHPLPSATQFAEFARSAGISADSQVVVYDDQRFAFAARAWWLLRHFGHERVAILNGGFSAWKEAGMPQESGPAKQGAVGDFNACARTDELLNHDDIYPHLGNPPWQLVDARDPKRFLGHEEPLDPIAGHIPTAVNMPWQAVTDERGYLRSDAELREHWQNIPADDDIVCYCGSGVTACVNLFSLAQVGRSAHLYPGSWSDWCARILHPRKASEQT
ncbi:sulfurtransferase [Microbulbifer aggregans]|uniref:sulfurtransferase n=1 Tax=Microbulbifer aggregans TaxID=1769779 RepID=UPI001CFC5604|nr:sulfurtransferase [Microbulbifer aggregans]